MKRLLACLFSLLLAVLSAAQGARPARELITCGREKVLILDLNTRDAAGTPKILWTWKAAGRPDLPPEYHALFRSTDECKLVSGGRRVLITSSTGGVALVERGNGAVVFYGRAANAHSADLLPNGRIAVAASRDPRERKGDALILFDITQSGRELWRTELPSGHGVVWDAGRQILWALSDRDIRSYRLANWSSPAPTLERLALTPLPESGGHDLFPIPGTALLSVTTSNHCWVFDRDAKEFRPHPALAAKSSIKSIAQHPVTGQIAFTQADRPEWWTERVRFLQPEESFTVPGEQFYKIRWNLPVD